MKPYLALILGAFLLATTTIFIRFIVGLDVFLITLFNFLFASIFFFVATILKKEKFELKNKKTLLVFGASQLGTFGFIYAAYLVAPIAPSIFLFYTAPIFALIMSPLLLKEKIQKISVISIVIAMLGIILIVNPEELFKLFTLSIGYVFALMAAFSYGLNLVLGRKLRDVYGPFSLTFFSFFIGFILILLLIPFLSSFQNITISNILIVIMMGLVSGVGYLLAYYALRHIIVQKGAIILLAEPVFATLLALTILQEIPTIFTIVGGIIILIAVAIESYAK